MRFVNGLTRGSFAVAAFVCAVVVSAGMIGCGGGGGSEGGSADVVESCMAFKVVNGEECTSDTLPVVRLIINGEGLCTGTIVSESMVLTAAHCVEGARSIEADHDRGRQSATRWLAHPNFRRIGIERAFDLGLIEFPGIATNFRVRPAQFGLSRLTEVGDQLKVVGYGLDGTPGLANNNPRGVTVTVRGEQDGLLVTSFDADGGGACFGDSGGAATYQGRVVATVQGGGNSCTAGNTGFFVDLSLPGNILFLSRNLPGVSLIGDDDGGDRGGPV